MTSDVRSACEGKYTGEVSVVEDEMAVERTVSNLVEAGVRGGESGKVCWTEVVADDVDELDGEYVEGSHVMIIIDDRHNLIFLAGSGSRSQWQYLPFLFFSHLHDDLHPPSTVSLLSRRSLPFFQSCPEHLLFDSLRAASSPFWSVPFLFSDTSNSVLNVSSSLRETHPHMWLLVCQRRWIQSYFNGLATP
jgi:hypothetical protein